MPIHEWPEEERPREKLLARGPTSLSDAELLALFLGSGFGGRDAVQTARDLLLAHGPLRVLLDRPARELSKLPGLGPARSCTLAAGLELAHRYLAAELQQGEAVGNNPVTVGRYLQHRLRGQARELFVVLFLDNRHRLIACEELFAGTINAAPVYPREVVRRALLHNAAAVILSHNHPSGDPEPSAADTQITEELHRALALVDIRLLDHFVVGEGRPVSFAERGLLPPLQARLVG
ncbi:DNA repair protein RadC [Stenotrophomonas sp. Br8]|uniref:RadC family protein n=1 Tax=Stenotrophomonas sp. Br8 TaxID=2759658 RepID=UPI00168BDEEF|nr:DNA repair protein RadC [Stenotrophomonas sp. Br8]MBD3682572.1 DNA repair protein RadC [Stenotrophomonas sp. Br8]